MDRLTEKTIGCFEYDLKDHEHVIGEFSTYDAFYAYRMAVKRLGQYEDTGLTPEEITSLYHDAGLSLAIRNNDLRARLDVTEAVAKAAYLYVVSEVRGTWDDRRVLYQELKDAVVAYEEVAGK